ncbi:MAG: InlB B-repeat-containing protein, partial [Bacilli bacterium]|nr:InlB B-repeat-containing protein [Bacilli bacterium]
MKGFLKKGFLIILFLPLFVYGKDLFSANSAIKGLESNMGVLPNIKLKEGNELGTYSINFNANTGTGTMAEQVVPLNQNVELYTNTFTKRGYMFTEWNTKEDGSGINYIDKQFVYNLSTTADMTVTLYAIWNPITYSIKYDSNNGSGTMNPQIMTYDSSQKLAFNGYSRKGHSFIGWNTKKDGTGTSYNDQQQVVNLASNNDATIILYAQWEKNTFSINFDANSGIGTMESQNFVYGNVQPLNKNTFTKPNYVFTGWNTKSDGSGVEVKDEAEGSILSTINNETLVLYAQWEIEKYTVTFNANTGSGTMAEQIFTFGTSSTLNDNKFTKNNYTFAGWNTNRDGTGENYSNKQNIIVNSNLTLYAQWAINTYTILYHSNSGTGAMSNQTIPVDMTQSLTPNTFVKTGYTFAGWNTKEDGTGNSYKDKEKIKNLSTINETKIVLYAQWKINTYKVVFNANGGTGSMGEQTFTYESAQSLSDNQFKKERNRFDGWNTKSDGTGTRYSNKQNVKNLTEEADGVVTLYAQWKDNTYVINFDANGGIGEMTSQTLVYGEEEQITANAFTKEGHTFDSWNTKADGTGKKYENEEKISTITAQNNVATLYAQWRINQYTISFMPNGGTGHMENMTITHGQSENLTKNSFYRNGYTFEGWNTKPDGTGTGYADEQSISSIPGYTILYAQWKGINYTVIFNANGGEGTMANEVFTYGSKIALPKNMFTKLRYGFKEWNTKEDGTGTSYKDQVDGSTLTTQANATVNLYAIWKNAQYEIKYNANGGSGSMDNQIIDYGQTVKLNPCTLTRTGYTFIGWNTEENGGGTLYTNEGSITNLTETNNEIINLYAQWKINTYTVNYNANGGEGTMSSQTFTYDVEKYLATSGFSREGYHMNGWNTKADG